MAGWPCCCSGYAAERIKEQGNQTRNRAEVTCAKCRRVMEKAVTW